VFNAEKGLLTNPEPPDDDFYIKADCGHEVYEGEYLVEDNNTGKIQCEECFRDEIDALPLSELAERFNSTSRAVKQWDS
jgi:hypothetical protein